MRNKSAPGEQKGEDKARDREEHLGAGRGYTLLVDSAIGQGGLSSWRSEPAASRESHRP
jgi:hypothetical protein